MPYNAWTGDFSTCFLHVRAGDAVLYGHGSQKGWENARDCCATV